MIQLSLCLTATLNAPFFKIIAGLSTHVVICLVSNLLRLASGSPPWYLLGKLKTLWDGHDQAIHYYTIQLLYSYYKGFNTDSNHSTHAGHMWHVAKQLRSITLLSVKVLNSLEKFVMIAQNSLL